MAMLDWSQCPAVESIPDKVGGAWVFRGTRCLYPLRSGDLGRGLSVSPNSCVGA